MTWKASETLRRLKPGTPEWEAAKAHAASEGLFGPQPKEKHWRPPRRNWPRSSPAPEINEAVETETQTEPVAELGDGDEEDEEEMTEKKTKTPPIRPLVKKACVICGKTFDALKGGKPKISCSEACRRKRKQATNKNYNDSRGLLMAKGRDVEQSPTAPAPTPSAAPRHDGRIDDGAAALWIERLDKLLELGAIDKGMYAVAVIQLTILQTGVRLEV